MAVTQPLHMVEMELISMAYLHFIGFTGVGLCIPTDMGEGGILLYINGRKFLIPSSVSPSTSLNDYLRNYTPFKVSPAKSTHVHSWFDSRHASHALASCQASTFVGRQQLFSKELSLRRATVYCRSHETGDAWGRAPSWHVERVGVVHVQLKSHSGTLTQVHMPHMSISCKYACFSLSP
jgi:hypothetical protein